MFSSSLVISATAGEDTGTDLVGQRLTGGFKCYRQNGLHAIIWGLSGIPYYINYVVDSANANDVRRFWDRHNQIRNAVAIALKMTERPDLNWNALPGECRGARGGPG